MITVDATTESLVDTDRAAAILGVTPQTLVVWRSTQRYPLAYIRVGRAIRYHVDDLAAFIASRRVTPTVLAAE